MVVGRGVITGVIISVSTSFFFFFWKALYYVLHITQ